MRQRAQEELKQVNEAYSILVNITKRLDEKIHPDEKIRPPKLYVSPRFIRFRDMAYGQIKSTTLEIKSIGGPYTRVSIEYLPKPWLNVAQGASLSNISLPARIKIDALGIHKEDPNSSCQLRVKMVNQSTGAVDQVIVNIERFLEPQSDFIKVSTSEIIFKDMPLNATNSKEFCVENASAKHIRGQIKTDQSWLKVIPDKIDIQSVRSSYVVTVNTRSLIPGFTDVGHINVITDNGSAQITVHLRTSERHTATHTNKPQIKFKAWVLVPIAAVLVIIGIAIRPTSPILKLDEDASYSFSDLKPNLDRSDSRSFTIANEGGQELSGTIASDKKWLHVDPSSIQVTNGKQNISLWVDTKDMAYELTDTGTIQITTNGGNSSIKVDLSTTSEPTPTMTATIKVGLYPQGIAVNPSTNRIYVANFGEGTVSVIDGASNTVLATIKVGKNPDGIAVNPSTNRIYVANQDSNTVSVIDGASNTVFATIKAGNIPEDIAVNPSANLIYIDNWKDGTVSVIDGVSNKVLTIIDVGVEPSGITVNTSINRVYVSNQHDNTVLVIDGASDIVITKIKVGESPSGIAADPGTNRIYVNNFVDETVSVIDGISNTILATIQAGNFSNGIAVNPDTNLIYTANEQNGNVSVINGISNTVLTTIKVGNIPEYMAVNPSTNCVYVTNNGDGTVSVVENESK